ncbi:MAG: hypothetical protein SOX02_03935 [Pyramidobacter sp.]|nr:hypothetical protein [Pyramidobacter sp.]MDY3212133.1 hypothetical protein [Pyramidobacter sp.]
MIFFPFDFVGAGEARQGIQLRGQISLRFQFLDPLDKRLDLSSEFLRVCNQFFGRLVKNERQIENVSCREVFVTIKNLLGDDFNGRVEIIFFVEPGDFLKLRLFVRYLPGDDKVHLTFGKVEFYVRRRFGISDKLVFIGIDQTRRHTRKQLPIAEENVDILAFAMIEQQLQDRAAAKAPVALIDGGFP